jgi:hypothetical protein
MIEIIWPIQKARERMICFEDKKNETIEKIQLSVTQMARVAASKFEIFSEGNLLIIVMSG